MRLSSRTATAATALAAALALLGGSGVGVATARAAPAGTGPWSQTDYNAAQSRANLAEHTLTRATVSTVRDLWAAAAPANQPPTGGCYLASPIVAPALAGGSVYAVTNGWLSRYSAATGRLVWRVAPGANYYMTYRSLAVAGGLVVLGELGCDSSSDPNGYIEAFSAATGARVWSHPVSPDGGALYRMVVSGGYVVAAGHSMGAGLVVSVFRLTTGKMAWYRLTKECHISDVLVDAGTVISYGCASSPDATKVTGRRLATGALAWSRVAGSLQLQRGDTDAVTGRHVYAVNPKGTVIAMDPLTGATQYPLPRARSVLAVGAGQAYATCGSTSVCAYATATGKLRWQARVGFVPVLAAEAAGLLYLDQGTVLNTGTGRVAATVWSETPPASSLAVGEGRIAVVTDPRVLDVYGLPGS